MIRQVETRNVKITTIIRDAAFVAGFNAVKAGKAFDPDAYEHAQRQWAYERGRQFAFLFDGPLKLGRSVNLGAAVQYARALQINAIM